MEQEIIDKVLKIYEDCLNEINSAKRWWDFIFNNKCRRAKKIAFKYNCNIGVCRLLRCLGIENHNIFVWINTHKMHGNGFWCNIPEYSSTEKKIIQVLEKRIEILKQYPN